MSSDTDSIEDERPKPPALLYKYVHPSRIESLETAAIRFTPPLNTNDIFEVRQTFDLLAGPKFQELFAKQATELDIDKALVDAAADAGLHLPASTLKALAGSVLGLDIDHFVKTALNDALENHLYPLMNSPDRIDDLLVSLGTNLLCLSLTEKMDSSPMWAHYADNSKGFVIAFSTDNVFFQRGGNAERQGLHKIKYFDGRMTEMLDDPYAALISKQADWSYEREWRLYCKVEEANKVISNAHDDIHLMEFPRSAVNRVILGTRAPDNLEREIRSVLDRYYPNEVSLTKVVADRGTARLTEHAV